MEVVLAWATQKRHIAVDGQVLCKTRSKTAGFSCANGQYNSLAMHGLPTNERTSGDVKYSHTEGIIPPLPLEAQPFPVITKSICAKCKKRYEAKITRKK